MIAVIDSVLGLIYWFSEQNPYIVWTFNGTVLTFLGWMMVNLVRGEKPNGS